MLNNIKNTINLKLSLCQRISSLFRLLLDMTEPFQKAKYLHTHRASKNSSYCTLTRLLIIIPFKLCTLFELGKIVFVIALIWIPLRLSVFFACWLAVFFLFLKLCIHHFCPLFCLILSSFLASTIYLPFIKFVAIFSSFY